MKILLLPGLATATLEHWVDSKAGILFQFATKIRVFEKF